MNTPNKYSSFWMVNKHRKSDQSKNEKSIEHTMVLSEYRRAIANFVKIVTGKNIPVVFNSDNDKSYTTGKYVVISAEMYDDSLDSTVGLALHEATHITDSDFEFFNPEQLVWKIPFDIRNKAESLGYGEKRIFSRIKKLTNWVEDNRIDALQYKNAPGYRGYYWAMMTRYFNKPSIVEALKDPTIARKETLNNYFFRTINIMNPSTDLDALKGLREISKVLNLSTISRLKNTNDAFDVALDLFKIMLKYVETYKEQKEREEKEKEEAGKEGQPGGTGAPHFGGDDDEDEDDEKLEGKHRKVLVKNAPVGSGGKPINEDDDFDEEIDFDDLSETQKELIKVLAEETKEQNDFIEGNTKKEKVTKSQSHNLDMINESGSSINVVPYYPDNYTPHEFNVVVLKNVSDAVFESDVFPFNYTSERYEDEVRDGFALGTILGKKLQVRNDERKTVYSRKEHGHLDKRLLSELGFNNTNIWQQTFIEEYTNGILHISIDASGSMSGIKFSKCIIVSCAIAKAASMIQNLDVVISLRGNTSQKNTSSGTTLPLVAIMYDSRKDKLSKIRKQFPRLDCPSSTPEGLCFAAIQNEIVSSSRNVKSYFLNLCDGEPAFTGYSGEPAALHTKGEIDKMRAKGVHVMAYYIATRGENRHNFDIMYGKSGKEIDVKNITQLATTLNKLFTSDEQKTTISV